VVKTWLRRDVLIALGVYTVCATVARGGLATSYHPGDVHHYSTFAHMIAQGKVPYRDFFMEYPPAALVPFLVPQVWAAHYLAIFKALMFVFGAGLIVLVGRFVPRPGLGALLVVAVSPFLLGPVFLTRYDLWAAFLGAAALLALLDERWALGAGLVAATVAAKLFAIALIPVVALYVWRRGGKPALQRAAIAFAITTVICWGPFLALGPGGVRFSLKEQLSRGLQIESTGASILLVLDKLGLYDTHWVRGLSIDLGGRVARAVGALTTVVEGLAIVLIAYLYVKARQTRESFTAAYVASAAAFVALGKVLSPQFLIWLIPLVPLVGSSLIDLLFLAALLFTQLEVNYGDHGLRRVDWSVWLLAVRNALLLAVLALTVRRLAGLRAAVSD
jgi:uncharacterized membrane protein